MEEADPQNSPSKGNTGVPVGFDQNHGEDNDITFSETELAKYVVEEATVSAQTTLLVESVQEASLASVSSQDVAAAAVKAPESAFSLELARTVVIDVIFDHGRHRHFHHPKRKVVDKTKEGPSHHTPGSQKCDDLNLVDGLDEEKGHHGHDSSDVKGSSKHTGVIRNCWHMTILLSWFNIPGLLSSEFVLSDFEVYIPRMFTDDQIKTL